MTPDELLALDATRLARVIAARQVSCRELMQATLDRIARLNPTFNAIVSLRDGATLLAEADARDAQLARGERLGWMHGFPIAIKDLSDAEGLPTTQARPPSACGCSPPTRLFVQRMAGAGAILIGKTNTPEFGLGSHTFNPVFGVTRNAWNPSRSAGGSSGGAAVALALGLLPVADGSDMFPLQPRSLEQRGRLPPSRGRVPAVPADDAFFQQLGTEGPRWGVRWKTWPACCARWPATTPGMPLALDEAWPEPDADDPLGAASGRRVGWLRSIWPDLPLEPGVREVRASRASRCWKASAAASSPAWPCRGSRTGAWLRLRQMLVGGKLGPLYAAQRELLKPEAQWEVEQSFQLTAAQLYEATAARTAVYHAFLRLFERYDVLVAPSAQVFPFDAEQRWPQSIAGVGMDTYHRWMEIVTPFTLSACRWPACRSDSVRAGLPMGMQLAGPPRGPAAARPGPCPAEQASGWTRQRPPALRA